MQGLVTFTRHPIEDLEKFMLQQDNKPFMTIKTNDNYVVLK